MVILTTLIFLGCNKNDSNCVGDNLGTVSFTAAERLIVPYAVQDTAVFLYQDMVKKVKYKCTDQGSTYQLIGENDTNSQGYAGCLGDFYNKEVYLTRFCSEPTHCMFLTAFTMNPFDSLHSANGLQIGLTVPGDTVHPFEGVFGFATDTIFNYPNYASSRVDQYYDTLTILGNEYYHVYRLKGSDPTANTEKVIYLLYSAKDGVLGFSTNRDHSWYLYDGPPR